MYKLKGAMEPFKSENRCTACSLLHWPDQGVGTSRLARQTTLDCLWNFTLTATSFFGDKSPRRCLETRHCQFPRVVTFFEVFIIGYKQWRASCAYKACMPTCWPSQRRAWPTSIACGRNWRTASRTLEDFLTRQCPQQAIEKPIIAV